MDFPVVLAALDRQLDYLYAALAILEPQGHCGKAACLRAVSNSCTRVFAIIHQALSSSRRS